jgi:D-alanine-D-alanine ligase
MIHGKGDNSNMTKLLILFGGQSSEHEVSCSSAASLIPNIDRQRFQVSVVGITKAGHWFYTTASMADIASGAWEHHPDNRPAFLSPNRAMPGLQVQTETGWEGVPVDCVFPVMHGQLCEDGAMQGLLELCGIPYVGPDVYASACCMDKTVTKLLADTAGVRQAAYVVVTAAQCKADPQQAVQRVEAGLGAYPFFVKPASAGSSVGVSKVHDRQELLRAFDTAGAVCTKILVEETITGREVEVAVLGNEDPKASVVGEVLAANEFYDYDAKYQNNASRTDIPANIPTDASQRLRQAAVAVYQALGCQGLSRVDFFLTEEGDVVFNEINTLPGFTTISMYPKLWEATGLGYSQLLTRLVELALERGCRVG